MQPITDSTVLSAAIVKKGVAVHYKTYRIKAVMGFYFVMSAAFLYSGLVLNAGNDWEIAGLYVCGMLTWTMMEYMLYMLGKITAVKKTGVVGHYRSYPFSAKHGEAFIPLPHGIAVAVVMFAGLYLIIGLNALCLMAGITNGYAFYAYIHHSLRVTQANLLFNKLKAHHRLHQYRYENGAAGISSVMWEKLFREIPSRHYKVKEYFYSLN